MLISDEVLRKLKECKFSAEKEFDELASDLNMEYYYESRNLDTVEEAEAQDAEGNFFDSGDADPSISEGIVKCVRTDNAIRKHIMYDVVADFFEVNNKNSDEHHIKKCTEELMSMIRKYKKEAKTVIELEQEFIDNCDKLLAVLDETRNRSKL